MVPDSAKKQGRQMGTSRRRHERRRGLRCRRVADRVSLLDDDDAELTQRGLSALESLTGG